MKQRVKQQKTNPVLKQPEVIDYLKSFQEKYVLAPIDKASNNVSVICKKYYVEVILKEIGVLGNGSFTYEKASQSKDEIVDENQEYSKRLGYCLSEKEKDLPTMYWIPKMHKNPIKHRFIIASKTCCTKPVSKSVSSAFKLIHRQTENFHRLSKFDANYNKIVFYEKIFIGDRIRDLKYIDELDIILLALEIKGELGILRKIKN